MDLASPDGFPELQTERLLLRRLRVEDANDVFRYARDPLVCRYTTWTAHQTVDDAREFISLIRASYSVRPVTSWTWGILLLDPGTLIGTISLLDISVSNSRAEIGYAIGREYWGRGITAEAAGSVLQYAFEVMGLNRVEAQCEPVNRASARVMEKVGMRFEGTLREKLFYKGSFHDMKMYSVLRSEYHAGEGPSGAGGHHTE